MQRLTLLRHAKSGWDNPALGDHDRPLDARGERAAAVMAIYMAQQDLIPSCILCSSAVRTQATANMLSRIWTTTDKKVPEQLIDQKLYLSSSDYIMAAAITEADQWDHILVLAHNPGMEHLVELLDPMNTRLSDSAMNQTGFPTAALASFTNPPMNWTDWRISPPSLTHFTKPKDLV